MTKCFLRCLFHAVWSNIVDRLFSQDHAWPTVLQTEHRLCHSVDQRTLSFRESKKARRIHLGFSASVWRWICLIGKQLRTVKMQQHTENRATLFEWLWAIRWSWLGPINTIRLCWKISLPRIKGGSLLLLLGGAGASQGLERVSNAPRWFPSQTIPYLLIVTDIVQMDAFGVWQAL